ncbi:ATP-dependent DNA helicase [Glaciihabitans arcticus]|uniref:ATP-dependent DNA helicase n=1 Tax=Glaciihabitans arcticus TaxID=2668039 RepID=UPI001EFFBBDA|nr:ATP-dependent RecD-like DNA helicase [Glaciihabitans arcticus]
MLANDRALLSQNLLSQLRNLVDGVAVLIHTEDATAEYDYPAIEAGHAFVKTEGKLGFLNRFYRLLQPSTSHYTFDGDGSERLMLKYYEYLHRVRDLLSRKFGLDTLHNLEDFPVDLDPALREYHQKIAERVNARSTPSRSDRSSRYYVLKTRPFFDGGRIYYEVTFAIPSDRPSISKFDHVIGFTEHDISDKHAANLTLRSDTIEVLGQTMPIVLITAWEVSIRGCELENFSRFFGPRSRVSTTSNEYKNLMRYLTKTGSTLLDVIDLPDTDYERIKGWVLDGTKTSHIYVSLDAARDIIQKVLPGYLMLRYLLLSLRNVVVRKQYSPSVCNRLSNLHLQWGCIPFETMPFCTYPMGHRTRFWDLWESIDPTGREHEMLARRINNNVDRHGMLYTPLSELEDFGDEVMPLIERHNSLLYNNSRHLARTLEVEKGHVFIRGYENDVVQIVEKLQGHAISGVGGWKPALSKWMDDLPVPLDDPTKAAALKSLYSESRVAMIYGAAGTGKSTMVNHIANYFNGKPMLFLANTHPAVDNLRRRVHTQHAEFRTIASHKNSTSATEYEVLVIDECSTVSNEDLLAVLSNTKFKLLLLVGDVYQIESIQFGNWFSIMRSFVPVSSVFELDKPWRTDNPQLLALWQKVRDLGEDITETMTRGHYSTPLSPELFSQRRDDEIILCLNYDGLYGINNVNRFLQSSNPNPAIEWGPATFKAGDPIVFNDSERFKGLIYNNLKGTIVGIDRQLGLIRFDVELHRTVTELDAWGLDLTWLHDSVVAFDVYELADSDDDDAASNTSVPFQVAYAASIHRAQGLEYESVKIVITDANEDAITHNIFYTAITRAREYLQVFWTPETEKTIVAQLERKSTAKDVSLLIARRGLVRS